MWRTTDAPRMEELFLGLRLDSGIDAGVAGLANTTTGERKILDLRDFSGEGRITLHDLEGELGCIQKSVDAPLDFRTHDAAAASRARIACRRASNFCPRSTTGTSIIRPSTLTAPDPAR